MPTSNIFKVKVDSYTVFREVIKLYLSKKFVRVNVRCFQKRCIVFRATKSTEPILKKRDGLFALARILLAPTDQAGQLLVVKLCAGEAIAKVSGHAETTGSCNCAAEL